MRAARISAILVAVLTILYSATAYADNRLLPTKMLQPGRFYAEVRYGQTMGEGKLSLSILELDVENIEHRINMGFGFGLSDGVDVEITAPYIATASSMWEGYIPLTGYVEIESYQEGFGDTAVAVRFRLSDQQSAGADALFSPIVVLPSGYRKDGQPEVKVDGVVSPGDEVKRDYPGEGVISYGAGFAVSGRAANLEPYFGCTYIFGGRRKRHDIKEHYADEARATFGFQAHTGPLAAFDFSVFVGYTSPETHEDDGKVRVAHHMTGGANVALYVEIGRDTTFVIGISYVMIETHMVDRDAGLRLEGATAMIPHIGFHILF
jgi:hypothetical protein